MMLKKVVSPACFRFLPWLLTLFFTMALSPVSFAESSAESPATLSIEDQLDFSAGLYIRNMYDMAASEYESLIETHPNHPQIDQAYYGLAESYFFGKKYELARDHYQEFLDLFEGHEKHGSARTRLAESFYHLGMKTEAFEIFEDLNSHSEEKVRTPANYFLGRIYLERDNLPAAKEKFVAVLQMKEGNPFLELAYYYLGEIALETGVLDEAEKAYLPLLESENKEMQQLAQFSMGKKYFGEELYTKAHEAFQKAYVGGPNAQVSEDAFLNDLKARYNAGEYDVLKTQFETQGEILVTRSKKIDAQVLLANGYVRQEAYDEALKIYNEVLLVVYAENLESEAPLLGKIEAQILSGRTGQALRTLEKIKIEELQAKDRFYYLQVEAHKGAREWKASLEALNRLIETFPDSNYTAQALLNRGYLLLEDHHLAEARSAFYDFGKRFPDHPMRAKVHEDAIQVSIEMGDWSLAIQDALFFLEQFPEHQNVREIHYQLGALYSERGEFALAHDVFLDHLKKYGDDDEEQDIYFRIGYNLQKLEKWEESLTYLQKIKKEQVEESLFYAALEIQSYAQVQLEKLSEAVELYRQIILEYPAHPLAPGVYFWTAKRLGSTSRALEMREILEKFRGNSQAGEYAAELNFYLAESYRLQNECSAALPFYETVLEAPGVFEVRAFLGKGNCLAAVEQYEESTVVLKEALKKAGADHAMAVEARMGLAQVYEAQGHLLEAAKGYFAIAILYEDPEHVPLALMKAGTSFRDAGKKMEARRVFLELVKRFPDHRFASEAAGEISNLT